MSMKYFETDGTRNGLNVFCPTCDMTCPYCDKEGLCRISDPLEECSDFGEYYESWEEYEEQASNDCQGDCENCDRWEWCQDIDDDVDETGFNPYEGAYDYDC